jgi:hypothetical protein
MLRYWQNKFEYVTVLRLDASFNLRAFAEQPDAAPTRALPAAEVLMPSLIGMVCTYQTETKT